MLRFLVPLALLVAPVSAQAQALDPRSVVAAHQAAYEALDIDAFLALYADDAVVDYGEMQFRGRDEIRAIYSANFAKGVPLFNIVSRTVAGNQVTDVEEVTTPSGRTLGYSIAVYTIRGGKIVHVLLGFREAG